ncbi:hypothetical protein KR222_009839 [Zaprionus bogoriensis]|nr:hypothetical protein KR222_009839 [Zaprionus bogoriensis]
MWQLLLLLLLLPVCLPAVRSSLNCPVENATRWQFHLVRECQRAATDEALALENTSTLEECMHLARELRGLALNYAPGGTQRHTNRYAQQPKDEDGKGTASRRYKDARRLLNVFEQPGEFFNCHVLQCPQNGSFAGMVNDSRYDYYSLYGRPAALQNMSCVPEVGLFVLFKRPSSYANASVSCSNASEFSGSLVHVASEARSYALAQWLSSYNRQPEPAIFLAYIGLQYNRSVALQPLDFRNAQQESLLCFLYSAWHLGHPRQLDSQANASCVALTLQGTWQTVHCEHELPFICEILAPASSTQLDTGANAAEQACAWSE